MSALLALLLLAHGRLAGAAADRCTTIGVTRGASAEGSTMVTHTSDCAECDSRVAHVPAAAWPEGAVRPVYAARLEYPREVSLRSPTYHPEQGQSLSKPTGFIPEVRSTYAYWEAVYGYMNEHGLSLGESTAAANFPVSRTNLTALLWVRPLTQIAMERCRTARCAVETMGGLSERYGFYGEDPGASGAGECLIIVDGREVWVFEITGDTTGTSAFWAARRIPEGHVTVIANNFVLRELDCEDHDNFRCSSNLLANVRNAGAWDGRGAFDWAKSMGPDIRYFSYTPGFPPIPEYTTARLWRVFSRIAPSLGLARTDNTYALPFSVRAEWRISARDLMDLKRDHYEGTELDLTVGAFAGPFGSPNRLEGGIGMKLNGGQFARAISLPRTSYCTLGESFGEAHSGSLDKLWFASDTPASSVFVPFYANTSAFAECYRTGHMAKYDERSAWWVFDFVANWMNLNYRLMSADVKDKIVELQDRIDSQRGPMERAVAAQLHSGDGDTATAELERFQQRLQRDVVDSWREFGRFLIMKYNDGFLNSPTVAKPIGYPAWWLQMLGLDTDIRPKWTRPGQKPPPLFESLGPGPFEVAPAQAGEEFLAGPRSRAASAEEAAGAGWALAGATYLAVFSAGLLLGRRGQRRSCGEADPAAAYRAMAGE